MNRAAAARPLRAVFAAGAFAGAMLAPQSSLAKASDVNAVISKIERNQCGALVQELRTSAAHGDGDAMRNLGLMYLRGCGVGKNTTTAARWYAKAAALGRAGDLGQALMYAHGVGVPHDGMRALTLAKQAAKSGTFGAPFYVALLYQTGNPPLKPDAAQTVLWARTAADRGDTFAQLVLGQLYLNGTGVAKDTNRAQALFETAAKNNEPSAETELGLLYELGTVVPRDKMKAIAYYRAAANGLDSAGQADLALAYLLGKGVRPDAKTAQHWATLSADQGDPFGMQVLADVLKKQRDYAGAENWYRRAAEQGLAMAQNDLAICYWYGWGVHADFRQAVKWYRIAAANGDPNAKGNLLQLQIVAEQNAPIPPPVPAFYSTQSGSVESGQRPYSPLDNPLSGESQAAQGVEDQNNYEVNHPGSEEPPH